MSSAIFFSKDWMSFSATAITLKEVILHYMCS
jgi:hypothetical protein